MLNIKSDDNIEQYFKQDVLDLYSFVCIGNKYGNDKYVIAGLIIKVAYRIMKLIPYEEISTLYDYLIDIDIDKYDKDTNLYFDLLIKIHRNNKAREELKKINKFLNEHRDDDKITELYDMEIKYVEDIFTKNNIGCQLL